MTGEPFTLMTWQQCQRMTFQRASPEVSAFGRCSPHRCCAREFPSGRFISAAWRSARSPRSRSNCLKPSPTKPSSPSRTCGLFQELKESLEQQTATSEILGVIASSPTDIQPVLDVVAESAARLCDATMHTVIRVDGDVYAIGRRSMAASASEVPPSNSRTIAGRAIIERRTIHIHDLAAELEAEFPESRSALSTSGTRTMLVTPLLREGTPIGAITFAARRSALSPRSKSNCSKPLPTRRSSPSRTCGCSKNWMSEPTN